MCATFPRVVRGGVFNGMVAWARETGAQIMSTCPFTNAMFERDPSSRDVQA